MNQTSLLHIVERFEGFVGKLPETIRRPVLSELTPLKELFLQQRPPRFLFVGSSELPMAEIMQALFYPDTKEQVSVAVTLVHRWTDWNIAGRGTISILDARDAQGSEGIEIKEELRRKPADVVFVVDGDVGKLAAANQWGESTSKIVIASAGRQDQSAELETLLNEQPTLRDRLLKVVNMTTKNAGEAAGLLSILSQQLPDEAKIEMIRISRDREAQHQVAQVLVKSTTAICAAIGAQPIPLADLPVLTTLQLVMVSGIMYISGRERSLRASTEFIGALGANVGAGMLLREGTRAILKFFPGWGNVVCGMVAGAGTYAIGRAATSYFLEGVSLKDARRTYLSARRRRAQRSLSDRKS